MHQVHRDLKPENILLNSMGDVKLTDFGISKELDNTLAMCKTMVGTRAYMSPERTQGAKYSYSSDVWSLGIILYEMATFKYPYNEKDSSFGLYNSIVDSPAPTLTSQTGHSPELCSFLSCW
jgi:serine/threonine protein kinase